MKPSFTTSEYLIITPIIRSTASLVLASRATLMAWRGSAKRAGNAQTFPAIYATNSGSKPALFLRTLVAIMRKSSLEYGLNCKTMNLESSSKGILVLLEATNILVLSLTSRVLPCLVSGTIPVWARERRTAISLVPIRSISSTNRISGSALNRRSAIPDLVACDPRTSVHPRWDSSSKNMVLAEPGMPV